MKKSVKALRISRCVNYNLKIESVGTFLNTSYHYMFFQALVPDRDSGSVLKAPPKSLLLFLHHSSRQVTNKLEINSLGLPTAVPFLSWDTDANYQ